MECYPVAVTGQLCLGRGITFQSNGFLFDYAILPDMKVDANAYQCAARVLGNTADYDNGLPVTVYLSASMRGRIERQERIAINTARRVAEEGWLAVGDEEFAEIAGDAPAAPEAEVSPMTFASVKEAKTWGDEHLVKTPSAMYPCDSAGGKTAKTHYILREPVPILTLEELLRTNNRLAAGQGKSREAATGTPKCHPVFVDGALRYVVVFKSFWRR
jgi:hypothetical protein